MYVTVSFNPDDHDINKYYEDDLFDLLASCKVKDADAIYICHVLQAAMTKEKRLYHTPFLPWLKLDFAKEHGIELLPTVELAIWFQDAILYTGFKNNHTASAKFMETLLAGTNMSIRLIKTALEIIKSLDGKDPSPLLYGLDLFYFILNRTSYEDAIKLLETEIGFPRLRNDFVTIKKRSEKILTHTALIQYNKLVNTRIAQYL